MKEFIKSLGDNIKIKILGIGGQGVVFAGRILAHSLFLEGKNISLRYSYGAEARGTPVYSDIVISNKEILSPYFKKADLVVVMDENSFKKYKECVGERTIIITDNIISLNSNAKILSKPFVEKLEKKRLKHNVLNMAFVGYIAKYLGVKFRTLERSLEHFNAKTIENLSALKLGYEML